MEHYSSRATVRQKIAKRAYIKAVATCTVVQVKSSPAYEPKDASKIYLDPLARISDANGADRYDSQNLHGQLEEGSTSMVPPSHGSVETESSQVLGNSEKIKLWVERELSDNINNHPSVGVDMEEVARFPYDNKNFIDRNFTLAEQEYAAQSPNPQITIAGRWCAKEAVFKSLSIPSRGAGAPMRDIEIVSQEGIPIVKTVKVSTDSIWWKMY